MPGIYLKHGGTYVAMTERAYDAESVLQELIASHPEMLAGDAAAYGSLVLVKREVGVNDQEDGGARWSRKCSTTPPPPGAMAARVRRGSGLTRIYRETALAFT